MSASVSVHGNPGPIPPCSQVVSAVLVHLATGTGTTCMEHAAGAPSATARGCPCVTARAAPHVIATAKASVQICHDWLGPGLDWNSRGDVRLLSIILLAL